MPRPDNNVIHINNTASNIMFAQLKKSEDKRYGGGSKLKIVFSSKEQLGSNQRK